jgi:hypothetical protein
MEGLPGRIEPAAYRERRTGSLGSYCSRERQCAGPGSSSHAPTQRTLPPLRWPAMGAPSAGIWRRARRTLLLALLASPTSLLCGGSGDGEGEQVRLQISLSLSLSRGCGRGCDRPGRRGLRRCGELSTLRWFWREKLLRTGAGDPSGSSAGEDDRVQPSRDRLLRLGERDDNVASRDDGRAVCMLSWGRFGNLPAHRRLQSTRCTCPKGDSQPAQVVVSLVVSD